MDVTKLKNNIQYHSGQSPAMGKARVEEVYNMLLICSSI